MTWVKFYDRKPPEGEFLITYCRGWRKGEYFIESWNHWDKKTQFCSPYNISYWWDGEPDIDKAIEDWKKCHLK
jgi:hypothetical protein